MVDAIDISAALGRAGYRITAPRQALARLIAGQDGHFTAEKLLGDAGRLRVRVARATVFRALEALTDTGIVERVDMPSGEHAFVVCEPAHHHHVVCGSCGRATRASDHGLERVAAAIGVETGYRIDTHRLELFGLCPDCQRKGHST
jgi:Fur family transcriptional regulator, ferric uptake regulator